VEYFTGSLSILPLAGDILMISDEFVEKVITESSATAEISILTFLGA
jgi:hypothetical protein